MSRFGPKWQQEGERPDYRFSLANERTFLAWIRTALALLAGAIALDQFAPGIAPTTIRTLGCLALAGIGAVLAVEAYRHWSVREQAMRHNEELPHAWLLLAMTTVVALAGVAVALLVLVR